MNKNEYFIDECINANYYFSYDKMLITHVGVYLNRNFGRNGPTEIGGGGR